ncbi:MAG: hypothetical protein OXH70_17555 [Acidobacteria bacterium]|nr:hypothetical protein [Acidobacteriota bacterium]
MWKLIERILVIACGLELVETFDVIEGAEVADIIVECEEVVEVIECSGLDSPLEDLSF